MLDKENGHLYSKVESNGTKIGISLSEIAQCIGYGVTNLNMLIGAGIYNRFAKFKPQNSSAQFNAWPTEQDRKNNNWGMNSMPTCISFAQLWSNAEKALTYPTPTPPYRMLDFDGYYHYAPKNIIHQMAGSKLVANAVFPDGVTIPFYILQRTGKLAMKGLGTNQTGIDYSSNLNVPSGLLNACITTEDLSWSGETLYGTTPYLLGIVVFNSDGSIAQKSGTGAIDKNAVYTCSKALEVPQDTYDMNMYIMQPTLSLSKGKYYAVGAAIYTTAVQVGETQTYKMLPLQSVVDRPNKFELEVSGAEAFEVTSVEVNGATGTSFRTTANNISVTFVVKNNSGRTLEYSTSHMSNYVNKWAMNCGIAGDVTTATGTTTINTSRTSAYNQIFKIADGGQVRLTYALSNIWSNNAGTAPSQISSGKVVITPKIAFDGEQLTQVGQAITITYGL